MPKLIRLYIINVAIGFALAAAFVGMILWFDIANLWHLVSTSNKGWLAVLVLWISNGIIFAGAQFGIAVMRMKDDDDRSGGNRITVPRHGPATVPVPADAGWGSRNWLRR